MKSLVRSLLCLLLLGALGAPAAACPRGGACLVVRLAPSAGQRPTAAVPLRRPRHLKASVPPTVIIEPVPSGVRTEIVRRPRPADKDEAAWLWKAIRKQTYKDLPSYEERNQLSFVFSPVMVTGTYETVPGLGVSGEF